MISWIRGVLNGNGAARVPAHVLTPDMLAAQQLADHADTRRRDHAQATADGRVYTLEEVREALACAIWHGVVEGRAHGILPRVWPGTAAETLDDRHRARPSVGVATADQRR